MAPMTFRTRIFITVALLCHLFLMPSLLISQLRPDSTVPVPSNPEMAAGEDEIELLSAVVQPGGEEVTIQAREQEKQGDLYKLRGEAQINFRTYVLRADEMTYNAKTGEATASGHVVLDGGPHNEHLTASHGTYNVNTSSGKFYDVVGTTGARARGRGVVLTTSNPFAFTGKEVEKVGPDKFIVRSGRVTSCRLPKPKWTFGAHEVEVIAGENAKIYNSTFHLFGLPVFYFPYLQHPVERAARQSGFLIPHLGRSTVKGFTVGEAFYWAMNRSMDMTLGAEYYSRRGWAQRGDYRWRPNETSFLNFTYFGVIDRGTPIKQTVFIPGVGDTPGESLDVNSNPGGREARLNAETEMPYGFRGVADLDYLSQYLFRVIYAERFNEAINTEIKSTAFASRTRDGYSLNAMSSRYQNFQSVAPGDVVTIVHAPSGEFAASDHKLGTSPLYWSFDAAVDGVSRRQPTFVTNDVVGRFDVAPNLSMPLHWQGWSFRPELTLRNTAYSQRVVFSTSNPTTLANVVSDSINRRAMDAVFEIRPPALAKVFNGTIGGHKIKHTIEPRIKYEKVTGVDNFREIIRFDDRDILANTNEIQYSIVNRLFAKQVPKAGCETKPAPPKPEPIEAAVGEEEEQQENATVPAVSSGCEAVSHEIVSWEVSQKYFFDPTFGGALIRGQRNVFTTTENLTGIAFLFQPRRFSPIVSRLRVSKGSSADVDWQLDYDTVHSRVNSTIALVNFRVPHNIGLSAGHALLQTPFDIGTSTLPSAPKFNQFRTQVSYGGLTRLGLNAGAVVGYDAFRGSLQYAAVQTSYNWDCCGLTFEYRRFKFGNIRDESQYRFALTLANIATFGTLRKQERLF